MLDIMIARLTHVEWSDQLDQSLRNKQLILNVRSHNECELGMWLYNEALREYGDIPEIELLETSHKNFHSAAERVVKWHNAPKISPQHDARAQIDFEEAQRDSKEIVYLLTLIEYKLLRGYQTDTEPSRNDVGDMLMHPLKTLNRLLLNDKSNSPRSNRVNISKASLDKLRHELHGQK